MGGLWTLECPNEGIFQGECKYEKGKKGFVLRCKKGLTTFKNPRTDTCEHETKRRNDNPRSYLPHGLTACERKHKDVRRVLSRCIKTLEKRGDVKSPVAVCRASIKCPP